MEIKGIISGEEEEKEKEEEKGNEERRNEERKKYKRFNPLHVLYKTKFLRVDNFSVLVIFYSITKFFCKNKN